MDVELLLPVWKSTSVSGTPDKSSLSHFSAMTRPPWQRTCPFSADDCAYAGHWIGPRPVVYKINSRLRHFGYGTGQITGLNVYYIGLPSRKTPRAWSVPGPRDLIHSGELLEPGTISPCTITMDHDAIICFMTDGLARGLALSSKPPLRAFTATRRHPLAPTGSRGPTPAPG